MTVKVDVNNLPSEFRFGDIAAQAAGGVLMSVGKNVLLATVARDETPSEGDFLPLTVQYIEKQYAVGRIPGGYVKRETKPGDFETLTSRIVDRSLRPLFPKGYTYPTQITVFVLSCEPDADLQVLALNAASAALYQSDIPIKRAVCGVRVGEVDGELVLNPTNSTLKNDSTLDLYVAGVGDELLMIEMRALSNENSMNEMSEERMVRAIEFAKNAIEAGSCAYENALKGHDKPAVELALKPEVENQNAYEFVAEFYAADVKAAINQMAKSERASELGKVAARVVADERSVEAGWSEEEILNAVEKFKHDTIRRQIVNEGVRADGRHTREVRPIRIETNLLPNAHGSCLFTRGQTQALVVATLGGDTDAQIYDVLTESSGVAERFMFNYNFPGFSVGEASMIKAPGRRELGHGNLAKRAIAPSLPHEHVFVTRVVSEILESNGSSSMASVCGGSLALRAAGVATRKLVAGVAMGLIFEGEKHAVLTDIMGLEDHDGDMDFKVAGSREGITALQMDIKLGGISTEVLAEALAQAKEGREHILSLMEEADARIVVNEENLPKIDVFGVEVSKIPDIIGQGGKTIREIIEKFGVTIDIDRENGNVKIIGSSVKRVDEAKAAVLEAAGSSRGFRGGRGERGERGGFERGERGEREPKVVVRVGECYNGVVKSLTKFGAFINLAGKTDGLLHISKLRRVRLNEGDRVDVVVTDVDGDKISLDFFR